MYLSRFKLDEHRRATMIALSNPSMFHGAIARAFEGPRPHVLWRIDSLNGSRYLMILSEAVPILDKAIAEYGTGEPAETKCYNRLLESVANGNHYAFRLRANPTYSVSKSANERGRICAHSTTAHQREWLIQQSQKNGFRVSEDEFDVTWFRWYRFGKNSGNKVSLLAVDFEGVLEVTNAELFLKAMTEGIGRGKAYGIGLITVMRISKD